MKKGLVIILSLFIVIAAVVQGCKRSTTPPGDPTPTITLTIPISEFLFDNMEDRDNRSETTLFGGYWYTYDDLASPNNGDSVVWPMSETAMIKYNYPTPVATFEMTAPGYGGSGYCARVSGRVTTTFQWGFIGMGADLKDAGGGPKIPINFIEQGYKRLKFWYKNGPSVAGTGNKAWKVKLNSTYNGLQDFNDQPIKAFTATDNWQLFDELLTSFTQEGWCSNTPGTCHEIENLLTSIVAIQFQTGYRPGAADLMIDDIYFVK